VVSVVLFHAGLRAVPGGYVGVDVFFVISGFLITGNILRRLDDRAFTLSGFYANRARRLVPAAFVTIATTCLLAYLILPATRFAQTAHDGLASALYVENWRLAARSVDYLAQGAGASPFQHFWSLGVEEQYYLLWPLLILVGIRVATRFHRSRRVGIGVALGVVLVASFTYSLIYTASHPSEAYYVTTTRMWELSVGGALALLQPVWQRLPAIPMRVAGWAGIGAIFFAVLVFDSSTAFPGGAALVPTLGAAAVISAGPTAGPWGPVALLGRRLPVFVGDISYSLYLWHWPLIVLAASQFTGSIPLWAGLAAGLGSVVPAWLSYRYIERPALRSRSFARTWPGIRLGALGTVGAAAAALVLAAAIPPPRFSPIAVSANGIATTAQGHLVKAGAEVLGDHPEGNPAGAPTRTSASIIPDPIGAADDIPPKQCIAGLTASSDVPCFYGNHRSRTAVELVGDSHTWQWIPAFAAMVSKQGWRGIVHAKASCPLIAAPVLLANVGAYPSCTQWNTAVSAAILREHPAMVIVSASTYLPDPQSANPADDATIIENGFKRAWQPLLDAGIKVVVLADTPVPLLNIPDCVSEHPHELQDCAVERSRAIQTTAQEIAQQSSAGMGFVDLDDAICPTSSCAPVIGSVLVYRDTNHLTATYVRTLSVLFDRAFDRVFLQLTRS
jgi:peptidoglycan/LPS O-acetylase OafA/YrhL